MPRYPSFTAAQVNTIHSGQLTYLLTITTDWDRCVLAHGWRGAFDSTLTKAHRYSVTYSRASLQTTSITSPIAIIRFVRLARTEIRTRELDDNVTVTLAIESYSTCQSAVETHSIHQWHRRSTMDYTCVHGGHTTNSRDRTAARAYATLRPLTSRRCRRPTSAEHSTPAGGEHRAVYISCLPAYLSAGVSRPSCKAIGCR